MRAAGCTLVVPVFEELFWRGWLMRWLIKPEFLGVPFGTYARFAFWAVAILFAAEHGPYWEVGLAAGILYNWWAVRTRSLADCILAHAATNGLLSIYILDVRPLGILVINLLAAGRIQYSDRSEVISFSLSSLWRTACRAPRARARFASPVRSE